MGAVRDIRATALACVLLAGVTGCGSDDRPSAASSTGTTSASSSSTTTAATTRTTTTTRPATTTTTQRPTPSRTTPTPTRARATTAQVLQPTVRYPQNAPAVGAGANAVVAALTDAQWAPMVGYSWTPGCPVGRSSLRAVAVNFWGFDGRRSRGVVVVASQVATSAAAAFTDLYHQGFRIRRMQPMDSRWGHHPKGPGANDYAAMDADNTSGFNCRYVGAQEDTKVWSRHAYGLAVDVNDFENPYVAANGSIYPDPYFLRHRSGPGVFTGSSSAAARAFTGRGFSWGGTDSPPDYQHFDR